MHSRIEQDTCLFQTRKSQWIARSRRRVETRPAFPTTVDFLNRDEASVWLRLDRPRQSVRTEERGDEA
jgi:hypothetical protein